MAEPNKYKFDYRNPENVEAEVPGAQKIKEDLSYETGEISSSNTYNGENTSNNGESSSKNNDSVKENPENGERIISSDAVQPELSEDGQVITRHRQVFSGKRNGIHGEPVMLGDKHVDKKARTKIPVSRFKQSVERVKAERREAKKKKELESQIPVKRSSIPKPVKEQKFPSTTVKKETITKTEISKETSEPVITKTVIRKELSTPTESKTEINNEVAETEDEFDKIYAEIVVNTPTEVVLDRSLLNPKVEDPEKLESKFEEIIHDYDEHKVEPIDVEAIKRSKIPFLKRKSQQDIELSAQYERTSKIIAARDKLRLRNSLTETEDFEDELDIELKNAQANEDADKANVSNEKMSPTTDTKTESEIKHEVITSPNSKTEITRQLTKTVSTSSSKENESVASSSIVETTNIKEVTANESNENKENKQQHITEKNMIKDSIKIGIPVFNSYVQEFSEKNETAVKVEVKRVLSYTSKNKELSDVNVTEIKSEIKEINTDTDNFEGQASKIEDIIFDVPYSEKNDVKSVKTIVTEKPKIIENEPMNFKEPSVDNAIQSRGEIERVISKIDYKEAIEQNDKSVKTIDTENPRIDNEIINFKQPSVDNEIQLRGKVERVISKIDSKEVIETEGNSRKSINELRKKKSVLSKIALFERKDIDEPVPNRAPRREIKLPKVIAKDWQKVDHVHIHTPLIVDEVFKPFEADTKHLKHEKNKAEYPLKNDVELTTIVRAERVTVQSNDSVHYTAENKVQIESKAVEENKLIEEMVPSPVTDSEYTVQKAEFATIIDVQHRKEPTITNDLPSPSKDLDKFEAKSLQTRTGSLTKLNTTRELQAPVVIPGFKPVSEMLRSFESKKDANRSSVLRTISKVEYPVTVKETHVKIPEVILSNKKTSSTAAISRTESYNNENYDDFVTINDYKSLDDVFSKESDYNKIKRQEDDMRRAKSLAELDLGDAVKGKVNNMILRMKSVDRMELDRKEIISQKEMPRKRSVSEKIALFEGKLTPSRSESTFPLRIFKSDKLKEIPRTERKLETKQSVIEINKYSRADIQREKSVSVNKEKRDTERIEKSDEEVIQKKIEELSNAKTKYGKVDNMPVIEVSNGVFMPVLAVGTALLDPRLVYHIVSASIDLGFRAIDSAYIYGNEKLVGEAIRDKIANGTVKREHLFIISKLWSTYHRTDLVEGACRASLEAMGLDYFDLYLIHNPMSFMEGGSPIPKIATVIQYSEHDYLDAWFGMESLVSKGLVRAIGVSNFNSVQLQRVMDKGKIKPVVNQVHRYTPWRIEVECHPYLSQQRLDLFCSERNVTLSCFGVLGSKGTPAELKNGQPAVIDDALVQVMASGLGVSPAQLLISYQLENGHGVVVKASSGAHLWDNLQALTVHLTMGQVDALHALNRNKRMFTFKGMGDTHKNYPFNIAF